MVLCFLLGGVVAGARGGAAQQQGGRAVEVVVIGADEDGIAVVGDSLAGRTDVAAIHLIGHGADGVADLQANGEPVPEALAEKRYSGEFRVRIPPQVHRELALAAAEQGVSLNRLASAPRMWLWDITGLRQ